MTDVITWWQHLPSDMNPAIFSMGSFTLRWYGMMYLVAFGVVYLLTRYRLSSEKLLFSQSFKGDALTWVMVGVVIGGKVSYILFYGLSSFFADPLGTLLPWAASSGGYRFPGITGMSYHGGVIGVMLAMWLFTRSRKSGFLQTFDLFIPSLPLGRLKVRGNSIGLS